MKGTKVTRIQFEIPGLATAKQYSPSRFALLCRLVDIGPTSENYRPWYVQLNPKCVVPTLRIGEKIVTNSATIMRYVNDTFDGLPLVPNSDSAHNQMEHFYALADTIKFRELTFSSFPNWIRNRMLLRKAIS